MIQVAQEQINNHLDALVSDFLEQTINAILAPRPTRSDCQTWPSATMRLHHFIEQLPSLYEGWNTPQVRPNDSRFAQLLQSVRGMTTPSVLHLLNSAVGYLEGDEVYCEVGTFQGATLLGALLGNPRCNAYAADNFSEFDPQGANYRQLLANLQRFQLQGQVCFANQDFEEFLAGLRRSAVRIGVYFYDASHDFRSQLLGLLLAVPLLADRALLIVDDSNFSAVKQATWDFLELQPECRLLLDLPTPGNEHPSFWNGLMVLGWERGIHNGYGFNLFRRMRQQALLDSLDVLQQVNLHTDGGTVRGTPVLG
jgi:protein O-GlcNAc transferase